MKLCHASLLALLCGACGGQSSPPPTTPAPAPPVAAAPSPAPAAAAQPEGTSTNQTTAAASSPEPTPSAEPAPPAEPEKPTRPVMDVLTAPEVAFMINYVSSAPKQAAEKSCDQEAAGDPQKRAECLSKVRDAFQADVLRFKKEGNRYVWTTYKRSGSVLSEVHTVPVEFTNESANSVTMKLKGRDTGKRPIFKHAKEIVLSIPNDYSIVVEDPELGRLVYEAKVGLVGK